MFDRTKSVASAPRKSSYNSLSLETVLTTLRLEIETSNTLTRSAYYNTELWNINSNIKEQGVVRLLVHLSK